MSVSHSPHGTMRSICDRNSFFFVRTCANSSLRPDRLTCLSIEACGSYFSADKLHDEEIERHSFTACPACGKDVVEGLSRAEFEDEYFRPRYSVVVRQFSGSVRGYIVSANSRHEVMKRLLEKLDFNYVAEVSIGEILVKEDEF